MNSGPVDLGPRSAMPQSSNSVEALPTAAAEGVHAFGVAREPDFVVSGEVLFTPADL